MAEVQDARPLSLFETPAVGCVVESEAVMEQNADKIAITVGPPGEAVAVESITSDDALDSVEGGSPDHGGATPVGATIDGLLLHEKRALEQPNNYYSWRPAGGAPAPVWSIPPDRQILSYSGGGQWLALVRKGFEAPMGDWELLLRKGAAGESCLLARSDSTTYSRDMRQYGPPGLAPRPSMEGDRVSWAEWYRHDSGGVRKRVVVYDIPSKTKRILAEVEDVTTGDIWSPSLGGESVGWLEERDGSPPKLVVASLRDGSRREVALQVRPIMALLADAGRYFELDYPTERTVSELSSGETVRITSFGGGSFTTGHYISWSAVSGHVGYYDVRTRIIHLVDTRGAKTVGAYLMGDYFTWQERRPHPTDKNRDGDPILISRFYAIRLPR